MKEAITICGSMTFSARMIQLAETLEQMNFQVFTPVDENGATDYHGLSEREQAVLKRQYIDLHLEKIKGSNSILIANFEKHDIDGYIGANTLMEMAFAYAFNKRIFVLYPIGEQRCKVEALGMQYENLDGVLESISDFSKYEGT